MCACYAFLLRLLFLGCATSATRIRRRRSGELRTGKKYYATRSTLNTTDSSTYVTWRCRKVAADAARKTSRIEIEGEKERRRERERAHNEEVASMYAKHTHAHIHAGDTSMTLGHF